MKKNARVVVIGAGLGGLSAAARLAHAGFEVDVFEKGATPGGRCNRLSLGGYHFDTGPTLLLMPEVLEETFKAVGRDVGDYLKLHRCDPNYRIHNRDGSTLTLSTDLTQMAKELERLEPGSFNRYLKFLALGERQYQISLEHFVGRNFSSALEMFTPANLRRVFQIHAHKNMYRDVGRSFQDDRLRAALTFQTMYLGISPFESPAVYALLPYTELAIGIWFPEGGMFAIPRALEQVAREEGARFHYRTPVKRILTEGGKTRGVLLDDGAFVEADVVLCNADLPWAYQHLLEGPPPRRLAKLKYTSSAYMLYLGVGKQVPGLLHHNVMFGRDYRGSFDDLFRRGRVPEDPSFYVNVPSRTDPTLAPAGKDSVYVLVPAPNQEAGLDWAEEGPKLRTKVFTRLGELGFGGIERHLEVERAFTPDDFAGEWNLDRGAAFGLSHHFSQVGPLRPANRHPKVGNLFFVGASTQPGTGVPMVMLSARLVTERILEHARAEGLEVRPPAPLALERAA